MIVTPGRSWRLTDYLLGLLGDLCVIVGLVLITVRSYGGVVQLHPAKFMPLAVYGALLLACGLIMVTHRIQPKAAQWALRVACVVLGWLAVCNLGEAIHLAWLALEHPAWHVTQLGWIGAALWAFAALTGLGVARSNEQRP